MIKTERMKEFLQGDSGTSGYQGLVVLLRLMPPQDTGALMPWTAEPAMNAGRTIRAKMTS